MDFNLNEIVIDRPLRAHKYDFSGRHLWTATQIQNLTLEMGGEAVYTVDSIGTNIMAFDRSKSASISFENALMHLGVLASQRGVQKRVANTITKLDMVCLEPLVVTGAPSAPVVNLTHTPKEITTGVYFKYVDKIDANYNTIETYELGETPADDFSVSAKVVTLPTGKRLQNGDRVMVKYTYEAEEGSQIIDSSDVFGSAGEFVIECLAYNPCDKENKLALNIIFPNGKEDNNVSLTISNELTHPVTINAMQDYCSTDKTLFRVEMVQG